MSYSKFVSEIHVRPDDIDMNNHVHFSKYLDLVLAARYEQMARDYKMSMDEFIQHGLGWVVSACFIQIKRPLLLGDIALVKTGILEYGTATAKVGFDIHRKKTEKLSADGYFEFTLVNLKSGRAEKLSEEIIKKYSI